MSAGVLQSGSVALGSLGGTRSASFHVDIVNPTGMELLTWAHAFTYVMAHILPLPYLMEEAAFELWATQIAQEPTLTPFDIPYPQGRSWREWAYSVNNALSTAAGG